MESPPEADRTNESTASRRIFPIRTVVLGALLPTLVFQIGIGAMLPVVAPTAVGMGATLATAGFVAALLPLGQLIADLPAGVLAAKIGDRYSMVIAGVVALISFLGAALAPGLITLGIAIFAVGAASAVFNLARHSYLTAITPPLNRARVMSTLAGAHRIGQFLGPFIGAFVIAGGDVRGVYILGAFAVAAATLVLLIVPSGSRPRTRSPRRQWARATDHPEKNRGASKPLTVRQLLQEHHKVFTSLGIAVVLIGAVRGARQTVIPLWGEHLGFDAVTISLIFGLAGSLDMVLFYPAGKVMDTLGRLWVAVPAVLIMGASMVVLPFTSTVFSVSIVAACMGLGNGLSSGILMTLGSDVAPSSGRAQFLSIWRVLQDTGSALGPLLVSVGALAGSLAIGIWVTGAIGAGAAGALMRWVPRWSVYANRTTRRSAGLAP